MKRTVFILLLLCSAVSAGAQAAGRGGVMGGREIRYPSRFQVVPVTLPNGRIGVVAVPTQFTTRQVGVRMDAQALVAPGSAVVVNVVGSAYQVKMSDGKKYTFAVGRDTIYKGERYRTMSVENGRMQIKNLRTGALEEVALVNP